MASRETPSQASSSKSSCARDSAKLRSPAQVEKLLPKAEREALAALYDKASSGNKLARETDPREVQASQVQSDFSD